MRSTRGIVLLALLFGCGGEAAAPTPPAEAPAPPAAPATPEAPAATATPEAPAAPATPEAPPAPTTPPVDLLHAVVTEIGVSSSFRDQPEQAGRIADGDLASAWNSATGELVGAWIDVRVPAGATVTSIEMTAGFTREGGREDLFTGNHRVSRVRVSRDGAALGEFPLDVESRALQSIPVTGGPGVYRIGVLEVVPGSHESWRETCISELRVMGQPGTAPTGTAPTASIGALAPGAAAAVPSEVAAAVEGDEGLGADEDAEGDEGDEGLDDDDFENVMALGTLIDHWISYDNNLYMVATRPASLGPPPPPTTPPPTRAAVFDEIIGFVSARAPNADTVLRTLATATDMSWSAREGDLESVITALDAAVATGSAPLQCSWSQQRFELRLFRIANVVGDASLNLIDRAEDAEAGEPDEGGHVASRAEARTLRRDATAGERFDTWLEEVMGEWNGENDAQVAARLAEQSPPPALGIQAQWDLLLQAGEPVVDSCSPEEEEYDDGDEY